MSDGSNLGITADRALGTIIGGDGQPTDDEIQTPEQVRARIAQAPDPCEGPAIFDAYGMEQGYSIATDAIAKAFLIADTERPGILEQKSYWPEGMEGIGGMERDACDAVWAYCMDRWPRFDDWIGGASGFMVGFAYNTARYCLSQPPAPNPAILHVNVPE